MPFSKTLAAAAAALIMIPAVTSCIENDRTMGEGLLPEESILSVGIKTFDLEVTNRTSDSTQAANNFSMLIGNMTDPVFGTMTSNAASYILPYSDSTDFGTDPVITSAYISLSVDSTYYLDNSQEGIHQRIKIYSLTERIDTNAVFCSSLTPSMYGPEPITTSDPVIYGQGELRIELKEEFARRLLSVTPEEYADTDLFLEKIPGVYIEAEPQISTAPGGRLNYLDLGNSTININYTLNDPDRGISGLDTTESFAFGYSAAFNFYTTGSSGLESSDPGEELYLEGLSGIKPHIEAAWIRETMEHWISEDGLEDKTVIISRAEMVFPYPESDEEDYDRFEKEHPLAIYAFTRTPWAADSSLYLTPLPEVTASTNIGSINRSLRQYSLDITAYLQELMKLQPEEIDSSYDLWIAPITYKTNLLGDIVYEFDNYNYNKIILNGPAAERRPTLTVTYGLME